MLSDKLLKLNFLKIHADKIVFILSVLVVFLFCVFLQLKNIRDKQNDYVKINETIQNMRYLGNDLDNFFLNQKPLAGYSEAKKKSTIFSKHLDYLSSIMTDKEISYYLANTKKYFKYKEDLIVKLVSHKSLEFNQLVDIINLSNIIKKSTHVDLNNTKYINSLIDTSLYNLIEIYMNLKIEKTVDKKSLEELKKQNSIIKDENIDEFLTKVDSSISDIIHDIAIRDKIKNIPLKFEISKLDIAYHARHNQLMTYKSRVLYTIFFISVILVFILFYIYIKSLHVKQELLSFKYAVENGDDSIIVTDIKRRITYVNDTFVKVSGYSKKDVLGKNPSILKSGELSKDFYGNINRVLDSGQKWSGEFINKKKNGEKFYEKSSITPIFTNNKLMGFLAIKQDVTDYIKQQKKVEFLAYYDPLTSLPNRLSLKNALKKEQKKTKQENYALSLLFMDIDEFKGINDTLGHEVGDRVLKEIATLLLSVIKEKNRVFRIGGDEFAVLILDGTYESIKVANSILKVLNNPIVIDGILLKTSTSIGISKYNSEFNSDVTSLIKNSDIALYEAKKNGKNKYYVFSKQLSDNVHKKWEVKQALSTALKNDEFHVVYQPKYKLSTKELTSIEALIRWENDKLGNISPDYFIPIAEDLSLIHEIGEFVFAKACEDFVDFSKVYSKLQNVSINVSTSQLINKNLGKDFQKIARDYDIPISKIGIEVTETHIMHDINENIISLQNMKDIGFKIILDDFGTGYSSMSYLKKLPIEILKIDKAFIDNICTDANDFNIVKATVALSKSFGYVTIGEGIETKEQEEVLLSLGVDYGQGYLFSKPKTKEELIKFMKNIS